MKIRRKGKKIHPTPPQTAATSLKSAAHDSLSVLNLLPAAILSLVAALSFQDREVLAYMIARSFKTITITGSINSSSSSSVVQEELKKTYSFHRSPVFDCECFDCYMSFWFRWDSSPNREVIHQAIEAFEEHLSSGEVAMKRSSNRRGKKKDKLPLPLPVQMIEEATSPSVENETLQPPVAETFTEIVETEVHPTAVEEDEEAAAAAVVRAAGGHAGFARKVFPDVLGVFNSRLWNLWGPNV